ncbi:hypothetical protein B566_EDAN015500 [Ephemera danica]|nr:hypothetical protein B566_EDAN015500 [Ephemera danica]
MVSLTELLLHCLTFAIFTAASYAGEAENQTMDSTQLLRRTKFDGRIVGGYPAPIISFPYQLTVRYNGRHLCGAAILSERFAISAGHCFTKDMTPSQLIVRAGSGSLYAGGTLHPVASIKIHPQFDIIKQDYDVSIIQVKTPFVINTRSAPVALPVPGSSPAVGTMAVVTGWGYTKEGTGGPTANLQYVKVPIVDLKECERNYIGLGRITSRMICAGYAEGKRDACQGDSGGPLVANGVLIGIVSWGAGCARPNLPGVYTNLSDLGVRTWIAGITGI